MECVGFRIKMDKKWQVVYVDRTENKLKAVIVIDYSHHDMRDMLLNFEGPNIEVISCQLLSSDLNVRQVSPYGEIENDQS